MISKFYLPCTPVEKTICYHWSEKLTESGPLCLILSAYGKDITELTLSHKEETGN